MPRVAPLPRFFEPLPKSFLGNGAGHWFRLFRTNVSPNTLSIGTRYPQTPSASSSLTSWDRPGRWLYCEKAWVSPGGDVKPWWGGEDTGGVLWRIWLRWPSGGETASSFLYSSVVVDSRCVNGEGRCDLLSKGVLWIWDDIRSDLRGFLLSCSFSPAGGYTMLRLSMTYEFQSGKQIGLPCPASIDYSSLLPVEAFLLPSLP